MMSESDWNGGSTWAMVEFLRSVNRLDDRLFRLFGVACCHRVWCFLPDERSRRAVGLSERMADGAVLDTKDYGNALGDATIAAHDVVPQSGHPQVVGRGATFYHAAYAAACSLGGEPWSASTFSTKAMRSAAYSSGSNYQNAVELERYHQAVILRDLFGNPFEPVAQIPSAWQTSSVLSLAAAAYDERNSDWTLDNGRLAILADALEEVGCDNANILAHCRGPDPHVRGCWVVDLLLAKE
jgi:hypothetical protein